MIRGLSAWKIVPIAVLLLVMAACRGDGPAGDPKLPVNSPIPEVDRREEPKPALESPFTDGGAR